MSSLVSLADSRLLQSVIDESARSSTINPYTTAGAIGWYVFLFVCCGVPMLCCCAGCSYLQMRKRRDDGLNDTTDTEVVVMDSSLSRMEANITVFSKQQEEKRKQHLLTAFDKHSMVITPQHLQDSSLSEGCTICLTSYQAGDSVVHSSNTKACQHVFHRDCIASWLMTRQSPLCPCCRQPFIQHDLSSHTRLTSSLSEEGSSGEEESTFVEDLSSDRISNESTVEDEAESGDGHSDTDEPDGTDSRIQRHSDPSLTRTEEAGDGGSSMSDMSEMDRSYRIHDKPPTTGQDSLNQPQRIQQIEMPSISSDRDKDEVDIQPNV